jgi:hypothetical protein
MIALAGSQLALAMTATGAANASAANTPGRYRITTGATGFHNVLDAAGDVIGLGTPVINWPFNGGNNQKQPQSDPRPRNVP